MKVLNCVALTIAIIGAINWGLIGFFDFNLVSGIFGDATAFTRVIYADGIYGACTGMGRLGIPCPDIPCNQLSMCTGNQYSA